MRIFVPKERAANERRVAATPETIEKFGQHGWSVVCEPGAGVSAGFSDEALAAAGAEPAPGDESAWSAANVVLTVAPLPAEKISRLSERALVVGLLNPYGELDQVERLASHGVASLALELLPRVTRAQSMDALSSQASIAGYKAVVLAASRLGKYFPLLMTAAGTISPARVVVMGAGVAGLQAVATAKRLGAVVEVSDIRPAVQEQVESLGGRFIELPMDESGAGSGGYAKEMTADFLKRQREILTEHVSAADVVITTAQVPGKRAPMLLATEMVEAMKAGAVVVDLAAAQGGNCELTRADEEVMHGGVLVLGPSNLAATMAHDASVLYARNILALLDHLRDEETGEIVLDLGDEIVAGALVTQSGEIVHEGVSARLAERRESRSLGPGRLVQRSGEPVA